MSYRHSGPFGAIERGPGRCGGGNAAKCADFVVPQLFAVNDDPVDRLTVAPV